MYFPKRIFVQNKILQYTNLRKITSRNVAFDIATHFDDDGYKLHLLEKGPPQVVELSKEDGLNHYRKMTLIRKIEHETGNLYMEKTVRGFCHLYTGQEAVCVGMMSVLRPQDTVITSYRCHAWAALMSGNLSSVFAEFIGNVSGLARGKGGSIHLFTKNFYGGNGIVGAHVPLGVGLALNHKYSGTDAISLTLYGDGAANQGQVFEVYNMAKLQMLPVIFTVENNSYSMGTSAHRAAANPEHYRQCAYIPGIQVNGNDILAVIEATKFALNHILEGKGPIILEMMTYRYVGHSMSDPGISYRTREEIKMVREQKDPIKHVKKLLLESNLATKEELKAIEKEVHKEVLQALQEAKSSKPAPVEELTADCYETYPGLIRETRMLTFSSHKKYGKYDDSKEYNCCLLYIFPV